MAAVDHLYPARPWRVKQPSKTRVKLHIQNHTSQASHDEDEGQATNKQALESSQIIANLPRTPCEHF
eukprot:6492524-Amphidinium_carterae.3